MNLIYLSPKRRAPKFFLRSQSRKWITIKSHGKQLRGVAVWGKLENPSPRAILIYFELRSNSSLITVISKLWHDIRAVFSHVYLQSFLLHDIRAFFCHVYLRSFLLCGVFIPKYMTIFLQTRIYMRTKKPIYMRYKQACGIWGHRKSSYKRHRIIPSAKNPFMYDGAEK